MYIIKKNIQKINVTCMICNVQEPSIKHVTKIQRLHYLFILIGKQNRTSMSVIGKIEPPTKSVHFKYTRNL